MEALQGDPRLQRVGLIGLGAGSLAAYCDHGQRWTFYEIDPAVIRIARSPRLFTFLSSAPGGAIDIVQGDGRIKLQESNDTFGLLVIDAFGSDAIPVHLLTREALEVYRDHLQPHGIVALHISNNYLDLEPVLAKLADSATPPLRCYVREDLTPTPEEREAGKMPSVWAAIVAAADDLPEPLRGTWRPARARDDVGEWTDHYSNIWRVFRWRGARE